MKDKNKKKEKKDKENKHHKDKKHKHLDEILETDSKFEFSESKLCKIIESGEHKNNMDEYIALVKDGHFVCGKCGRVAKDKKHLCNGLSFNK